MSTWAAVLMSLGLGIVGCGREVTVDQAPVVGEHGLSDDDLHVMAGLPLPPKTGDYVCAVADAGTADLPEISDEELRAIASRPISYRELFKVAAAGGRGCLIGRHDNAAILVEVGGDCDDCQGTGRLVRYDVAPSDCAAARGIVADRGSWPRPQPACVPPALAKEPSRGTAQWDGIKYKTRECAMNPSPPWSCIAEPQRSIYPTGIYEDPAKLHARNEFGCDYKDIDSIARPDLGPGTEDVYACGHLARYTCRPAPAGGADGGGPDRTPSSSTCSPWASCTGPTTCTRIPIE